MVNVPEKIAELELKLKEYRNINRIQAQIIHESQKKRKPCRDYCNADIEYIDKLEKALDKACEVLSSDLQKIDIDGDEKLVKESAEKWKKELMKNVE